MTAAWESSVKQYKEELFHKTIGIYVNTRALFTTTTVEYVCSFASFFEPPKLNI